MNKHNKPPLGPTPHFVALPVRIKDLADAISLFVENQLPANNEVVEKVTIASIRRWASEIICHCDTLDELRDCNAGKTKGDKDGKM